MGWILNLDKESVNTSILQHSEMISFSFFDVQMHYTANKTATVILFLVSFPF